MHSKERLGDVGGGGRTGGGRGGGWCGGKTGDGITGGDVNSCCGGSTGGARWTTRVARRLDRRSAFEDAALLLEGI